MESKKPKEKKIKEKKSKEKRRNSEKRKEKSRDAARCRRSRETDIFADLAAALPISSDQAAHLDKASVMRLAIAYFKVRSVVDALAEPLTKTEIVAEVDSLYPKALDGFMLVLASNGDMVYLSENVSDYLGISQMDMMGQSVYEYSHPCDHDEIRECLLMKPTDVHEKRPCSFFIRLKCTLTSKGRKVNLKSASYKVIHCTGRPMVSQNLVMNVTDNGDEGKFSGSSTGSGSEDSQDDNSDKENIRQSIGASLVVVGCPIPHPSNIEVPLGRHTFLSKHSLNMKFTYADERLSEHFGWSNKELVGKSVFEFHHALDNSALDKSFKSLFSKGQCETMAYRFLNRTGGYAWVVTQATLIHCSKQRKPLSVVCVNHILSEVECEDEVYSVRQLEARSASEKLKKDQEVEVNTEKPETKVPEVKEKVLVESIESIEEQDSTSDVYIREPVISESSRPLSVTALVFKDRVSDKIEWATQDKPAVEHDPIRHRGDWPQAVTRNLFTSTIGSTLTGQETQLPLPTSRPPPQTATASIFAPRTEDMNKGFLTFSEDQPGLTMLKDEPEDLTHLAPTPGDVCVPLEDTPFLSDMLDEFILGNENYCPLLSPSLPAELPNSDLTGESVKESDSFGESLESDPFFYRDTSPSPNISQNSNLLSPVLGKGSDSQSIDSLRSPDTNSPAVGSGISEDDMLMLSIDDVIADEELALRAPYIPMSDQDEALQLLISDDMVMWGPTQPPDKRKKWDMKDEDSNSYEESSLAKLLKSDDDLDKRSYGSLVNPVQVLGQTCRKGTLERSNKRLHGPTSPNAGGESKRIRCQDTSKIDTSPTTITATEVPKVDATKLLRTTSLREEVTNHSSLRVNEKEINDTQQSETLLLQQLIGDHDLSTAVKSSRQKILSNDQHSCQEDDAGGGGEKLQKRQSNSVLMNLLVSGCDETCVDLPALLKEKLCMPLHINVDDDQQISMKTPYLTTYTINPSSPSPKKLLVDSVTSSNSINDIYNSVSKYMDDFTYIDSTNVRSPGTELLEILGSTD
ncbi:hypoxia-inducible factor 1-alpha isoform X2 [Chelonus insularis]|uniref:hypoxia-inducible factor 1-alpha isoform X2 n=1 Tax=Chelonus insularis TaxID=460826 RepID=UPI00158C3132|nr:hypoxia-inducible factor 1-alpha isoform X2 [Chelonus insularis]